MDMSAPDNCEQLDASMQLLVDAYSASHVQRARLDAQDIRILAMAYAVAEQRTALRFGRRRRRRRSSRGTSARQWVSSVPRFARPTNYS